MVKGMPPFLIVQNGLRRVPGHPVALGKLCFLQLEGVPEVPASRLRGAATVRRGTESDLAALLALRNHPDLFLDRFAAGDHCVVAVVEGRIVGYEWFCVQPVHREGTWDYPIEIPPGFVYAYDAYVDPAYRNSGVWLRFKAYLGTWMVNAGKRGVITFVDYGNWASLRTHLRFGFRPAQSVVALNILGVKLFTIVMETMEIWRF